MIAGVDESLGRSRIVVGWVRLDGVWYEWECSGEVCVYKSCWQKRRKKGWVKGVARLAAFVNFELMNAILW